MAKMFCDHLEFPALGGKMDVVPGINSLWLDAKKKAGTYQGKCVLGIVVFLGHALMVSRFMQIKTARLTIRVKLMQSLQLL